MNIPKTEIAGRVGAPIQNLFPANSKTSDSDRITVRYFV